MNTDKLKEFAAAWGRKKRTETDLEEVKSELARLEKELMPEFINAGIEGTELVIRVGEAVPAPVEPPTT